jgi:U6 snRNA-associated Sm-like protein LSm4
MNVALEHVIITSADKRTFSSVDKATIRGSVISFVRIPDSVVETVQSKFQAAAVRGRGRGGLRGVPAPGTSQPGAPAFRGRGRGRGRGARGRGGAHAE